MKYLELMLWQRGFLRIWLTVILMACVCYGVWFFRRRERAGWAAAVTGCLDYLLLNQLNILENEIHPVSDLKVGVVLSIGGILTGAVSWMTVYFRRKSGRRVAYHSVRSAFDQLPAGLCYYRESGLLILVNLTMNRIGEELFGGSLKNGAEFWRAISEGKGKNRVFGGNSPAYRLEDGRIFSFERKGLRLEGILIYEVAAMDVTDEYHKLQELEQEEEKERNINRRMKRLLDSVEYVTMNKELLRIKMQLHDEIGQGILLLRHYLDRPTEEAREELVRLWGRNIRLLRKEELEAWQAPYYMAEKEAADLGITLRVEGGLPREEELIPVVDAALAAHIMNVYRHAGGDGILVKVEEERDVYSLTFTNNGAPPSGPVRETGGLRNLRRRVEAEGGTMEVEADPVFALKLKLPRPAE